VIAKKNAAKDSRLLTSALGAVATVACGLLLWITPSGAWWVNASYDHLFQFGTHPIADKITLILMDSEAFGALHQTRGQPWDRALHAELLNKLADDGCAMVVFDSFFREPRDPASDAALVAAMRRQKNVVLMAEQARMTYANFIGVQPILPAPEFLDAAKTNWGVAWLDPDLDLIVRRHWPFPSPSLYPSLAWTAAQLAGAKLDRQPQERWLRYYGQEGAWARMSYDFALTRPKNYFRDQIIFIGTEPQASLPNGEPDQFATPYTRWTGESTGGIEIMLTQFLNLVNGDWLLRPAPELELLILTTVGMLLGGTFCRIKLRTAVVIGAVTAALVAILTILCSYFSHYWFPWLIISAGQIPCALAWAVGTRIYHAERYQAKAIEKPPVVRGYKLFSPPFGQGAYGKVWLAKNKNGQWRAVKVIYSKNFEDNPEPYERELAGVSRYQPISHQHPGLLPVEFVSEKRDGHFFYIMELGDSLEPAWQSAPQKYRPRDLAGERARVAGHRLPVNECLRIGIALASALEFLHAHGLTHRDIKPQNVIFVNNQPKLADMGLIAEIRPPGEARTYIGTPGYMPPPPESPGTPQADVYALGMLLYVISSGRSAAAFPEIATTMEKTNELAVFMSLNEIILTACDSDLSRRYTSAAELGSALRALLSI
jgi:CHASE2 domain-containing sensor protein